MLESLEFSHLLELSHLILHLKDLDHLLVRWGLSRECKGRRVQTWMISGSERRRGGFSGFGSDGEIGGMRSDPLLRLSRPDT